MLYYTLLYYTILYFTDISLYICWAIMSNNREMGQIHRNFTSSQGWISGPQVVAVTEPHLFPHGSWHGPPPRQHPETLSALGAWRAQDLVAGDPCRCCLWFWGFLKPWGTSESSKIGRKTMVLGSFCWFFLRNSEKGCGSSGKWMKMVINHWTEWRTIFCNKPTADICMTYAVPLIWPWAFSNCTDDLNTLSLEDEPTYPWLMVVWYYLIWLNMIDHDTLFSGGDFNFRLNQTFFSGWLKDLQGSTVWPWSCDASLDISGEKTRHKCSGVEQTSLDATTCVHLVDSLNPSTTPSWNLNQWISMNVTPIWLKAKRQSHWETAMPTTMHGCTMSWTAYTTWRSA